MTNALDFDALTRKTIQSNGALEDLSNLYGLAFALPQWHFIARGEFPDVKPYIASNADVANGQSMVRVFTDTDRLLRFAEENNLTDVEGGTSMLSLPTDNIVDYLEQFIAEGVHGIWFNSDSGSDGFFIPLKQLRPVKEQLSKRVISEPQPTDAKTNEPDPHQRQGAHKTSQTATTSPSMPTESVSDPQVAIDKLSTLIEENAELIKGYDEENTMLSAIIGGSAEGMDLRPKEEKGVAIASVVQMLDSVRRQYDMSPKLFEFFIELCLEKRKFIIPALAFAVCTREEDKVRRLEQDEELTNELARWITYKLIPSGDLLCPPANERAEPVAKAPYSVQETAQTAPSAKPATFTPTQCWRLTNGQYLLQGTAEPLPSGAASIRLPNGGVIHQAAPYYLVTAEGHIISSYPTPRCSSLEDTLYMTDIHAVNDGQLYKFFWQQQLDDAEKVEAQIVNLPGFLRECECSELPFDPACISSR